MSVIEVKNISKTFKVKLKEKGLKGSLKSIVKPKCKCNKPTRIGHKVEGGKKVRVCKKCGAEI